jgi:hypothetical protein
MRLLHVILAAFNVALFASAAHLRATIPSVNMRKSHMRNILLLSASLLALTCTAASAGSITIGLQEDAGAIQQFSGGSNFAVIGASTTDFQVNNISASTAPTLTLSIFDSNALDIRQDSGAAATLHVFITAQDLMPPAALADLTIVITNTSNAPRWGVTETTLFDQGNGINSGHCT